MNRGHRKESEGSAHFRPTAHKVFVYICFYNNYNMIQNESTLIHQIISNQLQIPVRQIQATIALLQEGCTIPFISRYRKERTQGLDEIQIGSIAEAWEQMQTLMKRKETILNTIKEQEKLTPELERQITECFDAATLEDLYLPYKPKRKTRATVAKEKGLEPLAKYIFQQYTAPIQTKTLQFVNEAVPDTEAALAGARDIIAEWISEDATVREICRQNFERYGTISSKVIKGKEQEGIKYQDYFEYSGPLNRCPSHRLLAIRRGEREEILRVGIKPEEDKLLEKLERKLILGKSQASEQVRYALQDSFKRLLCPSIETETAAGYKLKADKDAILIFTENLRQLLLAAPLGQKRILALDPGFRTGCKVVCLDAQGNLLHNDTIYPHAPQNERSEAIRKVSRLVEQYKIEAIAIGNGTAGRETEHLIQHISFDRPLQVFSVSEDGASIYSASPVAREEFPQYDVTVRGAVSIGRRLMDPLAELVKIDPKSIGVGQYQHDVDQSMLKKSLDLTVESCVNRVGVNLNTASKHLLTYVSGLGPQLAQNIVDFRKNEGPFTSRNELKKVPRLGAKAFEQCAGFLRIPEAKNPLDNSAVHPESYAIATRMASDLNCTLEELIGNHDRLKMLDLSVYITADIGLPTLEDIARELAKPGLDPRTQAKVFEFAEGIFKMEDLQIGMVLPGIVTNMTNFGAFVDVGVKQDGLVHISEIANKFISSPTEVLQLHQHVTVKVIALDFERKRIQLSIKQATPQAS